MRVRNRERQRAWRRESGPKVRLPPLSLPRRASFSGDENSHFHDPRLQRRGHPSHGRRFRSPNRPHATHLVAQRARWYLFLQADQHPAAITLSASVASGDDKKTPSPRQAHTRRRGSDQRREPRVGRDSLENRWFGELRRANRLRSPLRGSLSFSPSNCIAVEPSHGPYRNRPYGIFNSDLAVELTWRRSKSRRQRSKSRDISVDFHHHNLRLPYPSSSISVVNIIIDRHHHCHHCLLLLLLLPSPVSVFLF